MGRKPTRECKLGNSRYVTYIYLDTHIPVGALPFSLILDAIEVPTRYAVQHSTGTPSTRPNHLLHPGNTALTANTCRQPPIYLARTSRRSCLRGSELRVGVALGNIAEQNLGSPNIFGNSFLRETPFGIRAGGQRYGVWRWVGVIRVVSRTSLWH